MPTKKKATRKTVTRAPAKKVSAAKKLQKYSGSELKKAYVKELSDKIGTDTAKMFTAKKKSDKNKIAKEIAKTKTELRKLC